MFLTFKFTLAEGGGVASNDDELGLAGTEGLEGRLVSQGDYSIKWEKNSISLSVHRNGNKANSRIERFRNKYFKQRTHPCQTSSQAQGAS